MYRRGIARFFVYFTGVKCGKLERELLLSRMTAARPYFDEKWHEPSRNQCGTTTGVALTQLLPVRVLSSLINRGVYERAMAELPDSEKTEKFFSAFAHFEERCKEFDRAR